MKARAELWVKLKVSDLVVETAWLTLTEKLDFAGDLRGLTRYFCWFMSVENEKSEEVIEELERVISMDSVFFNPNKHRYSLIIMKDFPKGSEAGEGAQSRRGDFSPEDDFTLRPELTSGRAGGDARAETLYACDCLITESGSPRSDGYSVRLNSRLKDVTISGMKAGEVWRIIVKAENGKEAADKVESMAVTRSRREGLLLNPHFQRFEAIAVKPLDD